MPPKTKEDLKQLRLKTLERLEQERFAIASKIETIEEKRNKLDNELAKFKAHHSEEFDIIQAEHVELIRLLGLKNTEITSLSKHASLNKWIATKKKLPTKEGNYTVKLKNKQTFRSYFFTDSYGEWWSSYRNDYDRLYTTRVTHWMPET